MHAIVVVGPDATLGICTFACPAQCVSPPGGRGFLARTSRSAGEQLFESRTPPFAQSAQAIRTIQARESLDTEGRRTLWSGAPAPAPPGPGPSALGPGSAGPVPGPGPEPGQVEKSTMFCSTVCAKCQRSRSLFVKNHHRLANLLIRSDLWRRRPGVGPGARGPGPGPWGLGLVPVARARGARPGPPGLGLGAGPRGRGPGRGPGGDCRKLA